MPSDDPRAVLAREQAALVDALVGGAPVPPGFDARRLAIAVASLQGKRTREVGQAWPALVAALDGAFASRFGAYARIHPAPVEGGPWADGLAFVAGAVRRRELDPDARRERDGAVAAHRVVDGRLVDRHPVSRAVRRVVRI